MASDLQSANQDCVDGFEFNKEEGLTFVQIEEIKNKNDEFYKVHKLDELDGIFSITKQVAVPDSDPLRYSVSNKKNGQFLLFNQMHFDPFTGMGTRVGTNVDATNLVNFFGGLGFKVDRYDNLPCAEILKILKKASADDGHVNANCFVCAILSHGDQVNNEDIIYGRDGFIRNREIFSLFKGDVCPYLAGKPKFFIIQACRGNNFDNGHPSLEGSDGIQADSRKYRRIPVEADFLYAYSTTPRYYSWRNQAEGSWFIQELVNVFKEQYEKLDVLSMLTLVNGKVAFDHESSAQGVMNMKKQIPSLTSQLTKFFYLKKLQL